MRGDRRDLPRLVGPGETGGARTRVGGPLPFPRVPCRAGDRARSLASRSCAPFADCPARRPRSSGGAGPGAGRSGSGRRRGPGRRRWARSRHSSARSTPSIWAPRSPCPCSTPSSPTTRTWWPQRYSSAATSCRRAERTIPSSPLGVRLAARTLTCADPHRPRRPPAGRRSRHRADPDHAGPALSRRHLAPARAGMAGDGRTSVGLGLSTVLFVLGAAVTNIWAPRAFAYTLIGVGAGRAARLRRPVADTMGARRRAAALHSQPLAGARHPGRRHRADRLRLLASLGGLAVRLRRAIVGRRRAVARRRRGRARLLSGLLVRRSPPVPPPSSERERVMPKLLRGAPYFPVGDVDASTGFYERVLGFKCEYKAGPPELAGAVRDPQPRRPRHHAAPRRGARAHPADASRRAAPGTPSSGSTTPRRSTPSSDRRGADIVYGPMMQDAYRMLEFAVRDRDGHVLGFGQTMELEPVQNVPSATAPARRSAGARQAAARRAVVDRAARRARQSARRPPDHRSRRPAAPPTAAIRGWTRTRGCSTRRTARWPTTCGAATSSPPPRSGSSTTSTWCRPRSAACGRTCPAATTASCPSWRCASSPAPRASTPWRSS